MLRVSGIISVHQALPYPCSAPSPSLALEHLETPNQPSTYLLSISTLPSLFSGDLLHRAFCGVLVTVHQPLHQPHHLTEHGGLGMGDFQLASAGLGVAGPQVHADHFEVHAGHHHDVQNPIEESLVEQVPCHRNVLVICRLEGRLLGQLKHLALSRLFVYLDNGTHVRLDQVQLLLAVAGHLEGDTGQIFVLLGRHDLDHFVVAGGVDCQVDQCVDHHLVEQVAHELEHHVWPVVILVPVFIPDALLYCLIHFLCKRLRVNLVLLLTSHGDECPMLTGPSGQRDENAVQLLGAELPFVRQVL
mmetsp:Transcript_64392/g.114679  ORF Transcript_64392/g.114679 Transcript_64392/m.114679 type:complete len:302 (-) Transcript_64392:1152-2057(-)